MEKISEQVDEALQENYDELEKLRKEKENVKSEGKSEAKADKNADEKPVVDAKDELSNYCSQLLLSFRPIPLYFLRTIVQRKDERSYFYNIFFFRRVRGKQRRRR